MSTTIDKDHLPTSFGAFKPVGHMLVGLPGDLQLQALSTSLQQAGWPADALLQFTPREGVAELEAMIDNAGGMAGFGYELTMMRRYLALSRQGVRWLLVKVDNDEQTEQAVALARDQSAMLAVRYRLLIVEELI